MTFSLRARLLTVVLPLFLIVGGLAFANLPGWVVAAGAGACGAVAAGALFLLTQPFVRLTKSSAGVAAVHKFTPPNGGDGCEAVNGTVDGLAWRVGQAQDALAAREHQFETALYELTASIGQVVADPRKAATVQPPTSPWPARNTAAAAAVKAVGQALASAQRRAAGFQNVFHDLPDAAIVTDGDYKVLGVNKAAADLFDLDPQEAVRKPLGELFRTPSTDLWEGEVPPLSPDQLREWVKAPSGGGCEAVAASAEDGGTRVAVTAKPMAERQNKQFVVLLLKDLTRQMKKDSDVRLHHRRLVAQRLCLLIENEAKPALEAIRTNATLLAQAAKQTGQRERFVPKVQRMMDDLSRQEVVITLLGWLGRLTKTFGSSQDMSEVKLRSAVDEVGEKLTAVYGDRGNTLEVNGDAGWLIADEEWVTVLLTGLLMHANLSCQQSAVKVDLRRRSLVKSDGEQGEVLVRYKGAMLPEEAMADVREPFRRPNSLALESTSTLGFPLGLAVANRITSLMTGQFTLDAEEGGCCVRVLLPTRATSSRVESIAAMVRGVKAGPADGTDAADLLSEWTVGGGGTGLELVSTATPAPVGAAALAVPDGPFGESVGDWFPGPQE